MGRVYNFSAGPSMLPEAVLKKAAEQMTNYEGCGMSVMEMSHRSRGIRSDYRPCGVSSPRTDEYSG